MNAWQYLIDRIGRERPQFGAASPGGGGSAMPSGFGQPQTGGGLPPEAGQFPMQTGGPGQMGNFPDLTTGGFMPQTGGGLPPQSFTGNPMATGGQLPPQAVQFPMQTGGPSQQMGFPGGQRMSAYDFEERSPWGNGFRGNFGMGAFR